MDIKIDDDAIRIKQVFPATVKKVFHCFTKGKIAQKWMAPGEMNCVEMEMDAVPGGKFRLTMENPNAENPKKERYTATGVYTQVLENERLAYTWQWQDAESPITQIDIEFQEVEEGCLVIFRHEGFLRRSAAESHADGWGGVVIKLGTYLREYQA